MNTPADSTPPATVTPRRRRIWQWIVGLTVAPVVVLTMVALSYITLDRDAAALRHQVMRASGAQWDTKVQVSIGSLTMGAVRTLLYFIHEDGVTEARDALHAVQSTSVGVYELPVGSPLPDFARAELFASTDRVMADRGWTRMVGVADHKDTVLLYVPSNLGNSDEVEICLAVVSGRELVVNTTRLVPSELMNFVAKHGADGFKSHLQIARR